MNNKLPKHYIIHKAQAPPLPRKERAHSLLVESLPEARELPCLPTEEFDNLNGLAPLRLAGVELSDQIILNGVVIHGEPGSGKTIVFNNLFSQILSRAAKNPDIRIFTTDPKAVVVPMLEHYGHFDFRIINPFDTRADCWAMYRDFSYPVLFPKLTNLLVPDGSSREHFWIAAPRLALKAVMHSFWEAGAKWYLRDLLSALSNEHTFEQVARLNHHGKHFFSLLAANKRNLHNVLVTMQTQLEPFSGVAAGYEIARRSHSGEFSLTDWATRKDKTTTLVLSYDLEMQSDLDHLYKIFFALVINKLLAGPETRTARSFFLIDEASMLADLHVLGELFDRGRSTGIAPVFATQYNATFDRVAKSNPKAREGLLADIPTKILLKCVGENAKWSSEHFGDIERVVENQSENNSYTSQVGASSSSHGTGTAEQRQIVKLVPPHIFAGLPRPTPATGVHMRVIGDPRFAGGYWKDILPFSEWGPLPTSHNGYLPVDKQKIVLQPWDHDDLDRLKLPYTVLPEDDNDKPPPPKPPKKPKPFTL